jgi:uncharacterized protein YicC (UPF0701 family)
MTNEHKEALAIGRTESKVVREYLDALRANKPKRGRKRTADSIKNRLTAIESELEDCDPLTEVKLIQERMDLEHELENMGGGVDLSSLETDFVKVAKNYSVRQGISYAAWRAVGIEPAVLQKAGISR